MYHRPLSPTPVSHFVSRRYFDGDDDEGNVIEDGEEMKNLLGSVDWGSNPLST